MQGLLENYSTTNMNYQKQMQELREENERLKKQLYGGNTPFN